MRGRLNSSGIRHLASGHVFSAFRISVICFFILLTNPKFSLALQLEARYVKLHCEMDKQQVERCAKDPCANAPKISYYGGSYYMDSMHLDIYHGVISIAPVNGSRRRYTLTGAAQFFLQQICKPDVSQILQYIKEREFRDDYNDIYPSASEGEPIPGINGWYLKKRNVDFENVEAKFEGRNSKAIEFKNISPQLPAVLSFGSKLYIVAKSKEEFKNKIAAAYMENQSWAFKNMIAEYVQKKQQEWINSLGIDFSKQMVIAISYGDWNHGPDVEVGISDINKEENELRVYYYVSGIPKSNDLKISFYYDLIVCERRDEPVVFYENTVRQQSLEK
jgi:hypothetical protein